jgi:hypothetical protein
MTDKLGVQLSADEAAAAIKVSKGAAAGGGRAGCVAGAEAGRPALCARVRLCTGALSAV